MIVSCLASWSRGCFGVNALATGELNYQGGERKTFYGATRVSRSPTPGRRSTIEACRWRPTRCPFDILLHRDTATVLAWNLFYFTVGRYSGLLPYFFPGLVAVALFLARRAERRHWQVGRCRAARVGAVVLIGYMPYTYSGGGGPIGNRYFVSFYPLFLFLMPARSERLAGRHRPGRRRAVHRQNPAEPVLLHRSTPGSTRRPARCAYCRSSARSSTICP